MTALFTPLPVWWYTRMVVHVARKSAARARNRLWSQVPRSFHRLDTLRYLEGFEVGVHVADHGVHRRRVGVVVVVHVVLPLLHQRMLQRAGLEERLLLLFSLLRFCFRAPCAAPAAAAPAAPVAVLGRRQTKLICATRAKRFRSPEKV